MIQDFSTVFVGKQAVRGRATPIRGNAAAKKIISTVLAGALLTAAAASLTFCLLIRSGVKEVAAQNTIKLELMKEQQGLYSQRTSLLDQETLTRTAGTLGLYLPDNRQLRRL
jgi:hypothetical protein